MSALGKLVASIILDTGEFTVGTDKAKYLAAATATSIDKSFKDVETSVKGAMLGIGAALAAGFGVSALKDQFDSYAKGAAALTDLALKAGTTVQFMSGIAPVAKLAGISLDDVAASAEKLSKGIVNSNRETAGAGHALAFLGISAKDSAGNLKNSGVLMEEIAGKLNGLQDGTAKTTIAMDLFGKSGANLLPFLRDLAEYGERNAKVTDQQAKLAKAYEQDIIRLTIAKDALFKVISKEILPVADAFVKTLLQMQTQSGGVKDSVDALAANGSIRDFAMGGVRAFALVLNAGDSVSRIFKLVGEEVGYQLANVTTALGAIGNAVVQFIRGNYKVAWQELTDASGKGAAMTAAHGEAVRAILDKPLAGDSFVNTFEGKLAGIDRELNSNTKETKASGDGYKQLSAEAVAGLNAIAKAQQALNEAVAKAAAGVANAKIAAEVKELDAAYQAGLVSVQSYYAQKAALLQRTLDIEKAQADAVYKGLVTELDALDRTALKGKDALAQKAKILEVQAKIEEAVGREREALMKQGEVSAILTEGQTKYWEALKKTFEPELKQTEMLKEQIEKFGLTTEQVTRLAKAKLEARLASIMATEGFSAEDKATQGLTDSLRAQILLLDKIAGQQDTLKALKEQSKTWDELSSKAGQFFGDLVMNGKSAFDRLRTEVKNFAQEIIALFAQRYILQMVAGVTGSGAAANAGAGSLAGNVLNALGGSGGAAGGLLDVLGLGGSAFGAAAGAGFSAGLSTLGIAASAGASAVGGFTAVLGAAVPVIGWIVAAGALAYSLLGSKPGGPKDGGSFNQTFDASGNAIGGQGSRYFTPSGQDASLAASGTTTAQSYFAALRALGGTAPGNVQFGLGFDTDPNGTAQNRTSASASVNGRSVYSNLDNSIGRDGAAIAPALQLEASRMLLAALKASTLPAYLSQVFDGLTPSTATQAQIDAALKQAAALKTIFEVVTRNPLADVAAAVTASQNQFQTALTNNATSIRNVMAAYDGTAATTQNLATATTAYYNAQVQLLIGIQNIRQSIGDMFGSTLRNIQLAGMDTQAKYNFYQQESAQLQAQIARSNDPAQIQALAARINANIQAAFNLLTPEQQRAQGGAFISQGQQTQSAIDARLEGIATRAAAATQSTLDSIKALIMAGAAEQTAAANTQVAAANTNLNAANTPRQLVIVLPGGGQQVTSFGG